LGNSGGPRDNAGGSRKKAWTIAQEMIHKRELIQCPE
jgi:hypothetical protein